MGNFFSGLLNGGLVSACGYPLDGAKSKNKNKSNYPKDQESSHKSGQYV
jgi:hypothetical protein